MLSTAKSEAVARDLKESLEKRGLAVVESNLAKGKKLSIESDKITIRIEAKDAVSKDIFGNDLDAFTPHEVKLAIDNASGATHSEVAKVMIDLAKYGFGLKIGEGADIAAAEAAADAAEEEAHNLHWPTKGA
jgi:hypothetical protein